MDHRIPRVDAGKGSVATFAVAAAPSTMVRQLTMARDEGRGFVPTLVELPIALPSEGGAVVIAARERPIHPALIEVGEERARSVQNRVADSITRFAGSMWFVYLHIAWFSIWIAVGVERYPFGLLTMIVSLEAIFLSTFVMISQNRQDDARRHLADQEWRMVQSEEQQNEELIDLSNQILDLTKAIHELTLVHTGAVDRPPSDSK